MLRYIHQHFCFCFQCWLLKLCRSYLLPKTRLSLQVIVMWIYAPPLLSSKHHVATPTSPHSCGRHRHHADERWTTTARLPRYAPGYTNLSSQLISVAYCGMFMSTDMCAYTYFSLWRQCCFGIVTYRDVNSVWYCCLFICVLTRSLLWHVYEFWYVCLHLFWFMMSMLFRDGNGSDLCQIEQLLVRQ
jgi:hypothetical protein